MPTSAHNPHSAHTPGIAPLLEAALDALRIRVAVLDDSGVIVVANRAWRNPAEAGAPGACDVPARPGPGENYIKACESARGGEHTVERAPIATGIRRIFANELLAFELESPCRSPDRTRWFLTRVERFEHDGRPHVLVTHNDITDTK